MKTIDRVREAHEKRAGESPRVFVAPGRVNLIGEHTDYNDGFVLPMAIEKKTFAAITPNNSDAVIVRSLEVDETFAIPIDEPFRRLRTWRDYAAGVVAAIQEESPLHHGFDVTIASDVPIGAGLSSSAAFEIALAQALTASAGVPQNGERLAAIGRRAEHEFVGIRSGPMDQLVSALAEPDCALSIDCRSLQTLAIAIPAGVAVLIMHSGVKHALASSEYNLRRQECEAAVAALRGFGLELNALRDATPEIFAKYAMRLSSPIRERAQHVIDEDARTLKAVQSLASGDLFTFGKLMNESHESLRTLYEVSVPELDAIVETVRSVEGVFGARMTGGGFGGCAIALVDKTAVAAARERVLAQYYRARNITPLMFVTEACEGARELI